MDISESNGKGFFLNLSSGGVSDVGLVRKRNEDSLLILDDAKVYCVADGMGGAAGGDVASQKVVETIRVALERGDHPLELRDKMFRIAEAVNDANAWIRNWAQQNGVQGTGTTLVTLVLSEEYPWAVNVLHAGDSRLYLFRENELRQISADHSIEAAIGGAEGRSIPNQFKGLITNAIGLKGSVSLELTHADQKKNDMWMLCSDGLSKMLSDEIIARFLSENQDTEAEVICQRLVEMANESGGTDNISVVMVKVNECSTMPDGASSVPFDEPLPDGEPETCSLDTDITEIVTGVDTSDSSDLVSIQTSELDEQSSDTGIGETDSLFGRRSLLLVVLGVCLVLGVASVFLTKGNNDEVQEIPSPEVTSKPIEGMVSVKATSLIPNTSLASIRAYGEQSGDWWTAYQEAEEFHPELRKTKEDKRDYEIIQRWYYVWSHAYNEPGALVDEFNSLVEAHAEVLKSVKVNRVVLADQPWPNDERARASEFCHRMYDLQQSLMGTLSEYCNQCANGISLLLSISKEDIIALFRIAGLPETESEGFFEGLRGVELALGSLDLWINKSRLYPVGKEPLASLVDTYIYHCNAEATLNKRFIEVIRFAPSEKISTRYPDVDIQKEFNALKDSKFIVLSMLDTRESDALTIDKEFPVELRAFMNQVKALDLRINRERGQ